MAQTRKSQICSGAGALKFSSGDFVDTKHYSAEDKARFGNLLARLIAEDFRPTLFTQALYSRLSMTFGHIAHHDRAGFQYHHFSSTASRLAFLEGLLQAPCYGLPSCTFSDVERAIQGWLVSEGHVEQWKARLKDEREAADRAELARLAALYPDAGVSPPPAQPPSFAKAPHHRTQAKQLSLAW